jgi:hypothetical protein
MPSFKRQMELNGNPDLISIEELINPNIDQLNYSNWIREKREYGKKKWNRPINRNKRRIAIKKKQLGLNK